MTPTQKQQVAAAVTIGGDRETAAHYAGLTAEIVAAEMLRDETFGREVRRAEATAETVIQAPSGSLSTDAASLRYIGNNAAANDPARGSLDDFRLYDATGLDFDNYLARALWLIGTINPAPP